MIDGLALGGPFSLEFVTWNQLDNLQVLFDFEVAINYCEYKLSNCESIL